MSIPLSHHSPLPSTPHTVICWIQAILPNWGWILTWVWNQFSIHCRSSGDAILCSLCSRNIYRVRCLGGGAYVQAFCNAGSHYFSFCHHRLFLFCWWFFLCFFLCAWVCEWRYCLFVLEWNGQNWAAQNLSQFSIFFLFLDYVTSVIMWRSWWNQEVKRILNIGRDSKGPS